MTSRKVRGEAREGGFYEEDKRWVILHDLDCWLEGWRMVRRGDHWLILPRVLRYTWININFGVVDRKRMGEGAAEKRREERIILKLVQERLNIVPYTEPNHRQRPRNPLE